MFCACRQLAGNVSKHVAMMSELSRLVDSRRLMDVSELEQEMVCGLDHGSAIDRVMKFMHDHNGVLRVSQVMLLRVLNSSV